MSTQDFLNKQLALLPRWFGDDFPNLIATLTGSAVCNDFVYGLLKYIRLQLRLQDMSGETLDLFSQTYFGKKLLRHFDESDDSYRTRISVTLLRPGATRQAMIDVLTSLTGRVPIIWESGIDSAFYNHAFYGHSTYGASDDAYQAWIIAYRPISPEQAGTSYYGQTGFYGHSFYQTSFTNGITDQDILDAIEATKVYGTLMHVTLLD